MKEVKLLSNSELNEALISYPIYALDDECDRESAQGIADHLGISVNEYDKYSRAVVREYKTRGMR